MESGAVHQQFETAIRADDAAKVRQLFSEYPQAKELINEPFCSFNSPPLLLVRSKGMLDVFLEAGADIDRKSEWWAGGFGFLHVAPQEVALYAIERGAKVDIHAAARLGLLNELLKLLNKDRHKVNARGGDGQTPLHFASSIEVAKILLENEADIDALDFDHESTPAQHMIRDRQDVARYLVERGCQTDLLLVAALGLNDQVNAILNSKPESIEITVSERWFPKKNPRTGGTIYTWTLGSNKSVHAVAKEFGHMALFEKLMERSAPSLRFAVACEIKDWALARKMFAEDPQIVFHLPADQLRTLPEAAERNDTEAVAHMLEFGWPIHSRSRHHATSLHWAGFHGNTQMAEVLLRHGALVADAENEFNGTPLGWAIHGSEHGWYCHTGDYPGTVKLLLKHGSPLPSKISGNQGVQEILQNHGVHR